MQSHYDVASGRETGCTKAEWLRWLPGAVGAHPLVIDRFSTTVQIQNGTLGLSWQALFPRVIALLRLPRLQVDFRFEGLTDAQCHAFTRYFDLYMQTGGG